METKIKLNDGSEFDGKVSLMAGQLYLFFPGQTLNGIYPYVSDESNVSTIIYIEGEKRTQITGYSKLFEIKQENENLVSVGLLRG